MCENEIINICIEIAEQNKCEKWYEVRKFRISANKKAHSIKAKLIKDYVEAAKSFLTF